MKNTTDSLWFAFHDTMLLLKKGAQGLEAIPRGSESPFPEPGGAVHFLGTYASCPCYAVKLSAPPCDAENFECTSLRASYDILGESLYTIAGKGAEFIHWDAFSKFCSRCGTPTEEHSPLSKKCPSCGNEIFPSISVAAIVLIRKGEKALLVRGRNNPRPTHGLVAGFLEPGESLEDCVTREVREETGLEIANVTYFGSQPWPYPCGLMAGFTADYKSGEIRIQEEELLSAAFFSRENPPILPHKLSIARRLIDSWLDQKKPFALCSKTGD